MVKPHAYGPHTLKTDPYYTHTQQDSTMIAEMSGTECVMLIRETLDNYITSSHTVRIFNIWPRKQDRIKKLPHMAHVSRSYFNLMANLRPVRVNLSP
jgi:hypothetical protein